MHRKRSLQFLFGLTLGAVLVWWLFRGTDWPAVWASIRRVHLGWMAVSLATVGLSFVTRVQRWTYIVRAGSPATFRQMFSATQIGFLANFTLPGRVGEAIRALALSRLARIPFSKSFAMVALDRVTDLVALMVTMLITVVVFRPEEDIVLPAEIYGQPIPAHIVRSGAVGSGLFLCGVVGVLVMLYVNQRLALRLSDACVGLVSRRLAARVHTLLEQFAEGLHVFRSPGDMAKAVGFSLVTWALFPIFYGAIAAAFGVTWPWYGPIVLVAVLAVVLSIPGAPGFVGQFHIAIVVVLTALTPDLDLAEAKAMAILAHLVNLVPITIIGVFCLFWEDLRLFELSRASEDAEATTEGK